MRLTYVGLSILEAAKTVMLLVLMAVNESKGDVQNSVLLQGLIVGSVPPVLSLALHIAILCLLKKVDVFQHLAQESNHVVER